MHSGICNKVAHLNVSFCSWRRICVCFIRFRGVRWVVSTVTVFAPASAGVMDSFEWLSMRCSMTTTLSAARRLTACLLYFEYVLTISAVRPPKS